VLNAMETRKELKSFTNDSSTQKVMPFSQDSWNRQEMFL